MSIPAASIIRAPDGIADAPYTLPSCAFQLA
jgi:hypothetical protein